VQHLADQIKIPLGWDLLQETTGDNLGAVSDTIIGQDSRCLDERLR
jgi:hypothetical protein